VLHITTSIRSASGLHDIHSLLCDACPGQYMIFLVKTAYLEALLVPSWLEYQLPFNLCRCPHGFYLLVPRFTGLLRTSWLLQADRPKDGATWSVSISSHTFS